MQTSAYEHFNNTHLHMVGMQTLHNSAYLNAVAQCRVGLCPMVVEAYGASGTEAMELFSLLASRLATSFNRAKAEVLAALYGRLNLRANATAILSRCFIPDYYL